MNFLLLISILTSAGGRAAFATLTEYPENTAVTAGETVTLTCTANQAPPQTRVLWAEFALSVFGYMLSDRREIVQTHPNAARYSISGEETNNEYHLVIRDLKVADGGLYLCQDINDAPPNVFRRYAQMVVFASKPVCTSHSTNSDGSVIEGHSYTAHCQVDFQTDAIIPYMEWFGPDNVLTYYANRTRTNTRLTADLYFTAIRSMEGVSFKCKTNFRELDQIRDNYADNIPDYEHTFDLPALSVKWEPKNMQVTPVKLVYSVGDELTCWADANPAVQQYRWQRMDGSGETIMSQTFKIRDDMAGKATTLRCSARNNISGTVYTTELTLNVYVSLQ